MVAGDVCTGADVEVLGKVYNILINEENYVFGDLFFSMSSVINTNAPTGEDCCL